MFKYIHNIHSNNINTYCPVPPLGVMDASINEQWKELYLTNRLECDKEGNVNVNKYMEMSTIFHWNKKTDLSHWAGENLEQQLFVPRLQLLFFLKHAHYSPVDCYFFLDVFQYVERELKFNFFEHNTDHDPIKVYVRDFDDLGADGYILPPNDGLAKPFEETDCYNINLDKNGKIDRVLYSFIHELIHLKQMLERRLNCWVFENAWYIKWLDWPEASASIIMKGLPWKDRPWEQEAETGATAIYDKMVSSTGLPWAHRLGEQVKKASKLELQNLYSNYTYGID